MGCGSSKAAMVAPQRANETWTPSKRVQAFTDESDTDLQADGVVADKGSSQGKDRQWLTADGSTQGGVIAVKAAPEGETCLDSGTIRTNSADSASSKATCSSSDSGLGEEYAHIVTEHSQKDQQKVAELPDDVQPARLTIEGQKITTPATHGHRKRLTLTSHRPPPHPNGIPQPPGKPSHMVSFAPNNKVLDLPESPSIVQRPVSRGGLAFEVFLGNKGDDTQLRGSRQKTPAVVKLERTPKNLPSKDQLLQQQRVAEERRKVGIRQWSGSQVPWSYFFL